MTNEPKKIAIITGVNKGLGKAFYDLLRREVNIDVIAIGRSFLPEQIVHSKKENIRLIYQDLSEMKNVGKDLKLQKYYKTKYQEVIFINNAATIEPIARIGEYNEEAVLKSILLNFNTTVLITNHLLKHNSDTFIKILNISSGAAKRPIVGWGMYCALKSANELFFEVLNEQEKDKGKAVAYSIDPGVMDTDMQYKIRNVNVTEMPSVKNFQNFQKEGKLQSPKDVAKNILIDKNVINKL